MGKQMYRDVQRGSSEKAAEQQRESDEATVEFDNERIKNAHDRVETVVDDADTILEKIAIGLGWITLEGFEPAA